MTTRIYHQKPPSEDALENITSLHIDRFQGEQGSYFREILIREIDLLPHFDYLEDYPSYHGLKVRMITTGAKI